MCDPHSVRCGFCNRGSDVEDVCGHLHSEMTRNGVLVAAHHRCMQYSATLVQYKFEHFGGFKIAKVQEEMKRAKSLKCFICKKMKNKKTPKGGASAGCALKECRRSFHYYCAKTDSITISKRLVVSVKAKNEKTVLYRVFCCADHETVYRKKLKSYCVSDLARGLEENTSDLSDEEGNNDDDHMADFSTCLSPDPGNTSVLSLNDSDEMTFRKPQLCVSKIGATRSSQKMSVAKTTTLSSSTKAADDINIHSPAPISNKKRSRKKNVKNISEPDLKLSNNDPTKFPLPVKSRAELSSPKKSLKINPFVSLKCQPEMLNFNSKLDNGISKLQNISKKSPKPQPDVCVNSVSNSKQKSPAVKSSLQNEDVERNGKISGSSKTKQQDVSLSETNSCPSAMYTDTDEDYDSDRTVLPDEHGPSDCDMEDNNLRSHHLMARREYVLCVPAISVVTDALRSAISTKVIREAGSVVSILMWQDLHSNVSHNDMQISFLIKDLAECINSNNIDQLKNFLLNSKYIEKKINTEYKIQTKLLQDLEEPMIQNQIMEKTVTKASELLSSVSGTLKSCKSSIFSVQNYNILKITITDRLDQDGTIRALWPNESLGEEMMIWNHSTRLLKELRSTYSHVCEDKQLEKWLSHLKSPICSVVVYPQEAVLRVSEQSTELVKHLQQKNNTNHAAVGSTVLIFERLDTDVVIFEKYFKKVLQTIDCTWLSSLVIVLPAEHVGRNADRATVMSLLPSSLQSGAKVLTVVDPTIMSCSWIVLQTTSALASKDKVKICSSASTATSSALPSASLSVSSSLQRNKRKRERVPRHSVSKYVKKGPNK